MSSRFPARDSARSSLFGGYDAQKAHSRPSSAGPSNLRPPTSTYAYPSPSEPSFSAYPGSNLRQERSQSAQGMRSSFEKKGYTNAVLDELEGQNDREVSEMSKRVGMLKDITMRIGDEIRDSTALAEKMNDSFGDTGNKLKGTMNRMLRMAEKTGVGWRIWLLFFAFVIGLFWYVWLF